MKYAYKVADVARILRISTRTVYSIIRAGDLKAIYVRGQIRIMSTELDNYIERGGKKNE